MEATRLLWIGWQQAIREWIYKEKPELADEFVRFFGLAFKPISYPEQAYFGVHSTCVSLCVGNIWLAAFDKRSWSFWLLVDEQWSDSRFEFELAKSTKRYIPLYWLKVAPERLTEVLQSPGIWNSYASACLKVLESPVSRINIPKNRINKVRLSDLMVSTAEQLPEDSLFSSPYGQDEFAEGGIQEITVELRKRNPHLKKQAIARYGYRCQICGFSFEEFYGELGKGYVEIHHIIPLSEREAETTTRIEDVVVVCANCHRILHRNGKRPIPIEYLQEAVKRKKQKAD